jgi:outer membrane biosynthesis protein TonB
MHELVKKFLAKIKITVDEGEELTQRELHEFAFHVKEMMGMTPTAYWHMMLSEFTLTEFLAPHLKESEEDTSGSADTAAATDTSQSDSTPSPTDTAAAAPPLPPVQVQDTLETEEETPPATEPVAPVSEPAPAPEPTPEPPAPTEPPAPSDSENT